MTIVVYILFSERSGKFYTGQTHDLENRLLEHNSGETASLRSGIPWQLVWNQTCASRSQAMKLENQIKKRGAKRFLADVSRGA
jgi:putative endonuclease